MTGVWIWGGGGHGRVVADVVLACGHAIRGVIDRDPPGLAAQWHNCTVWTESEFRRMLADSELPQSYTIALGVGDNGDRSGIAATLPQPHLLTLIHPSAWVSPRVGLGVGTVIMPGAMVNADARIGGACIVNTGAIIEHDVVVGDGAHISPGAVVAGGAKIGRLAWIGANATVLPGISIGDDAVVGAGAVVIRDVANGQTVVGVPARILR